MERCLYFVDTICCLKIRKDPQLLRNLSVLKSASVKRYPGFVVSVSVMYGVQCREVNEISKGKYKS